MATCLLHVKDNNIFTSLSLRKIFVTNCNVLKVLITKTNSFCKGYLRFKMVKNHLKRRIEP